MRVSSCIDDKSFRFARGAATTEFVVSAGVLVSLLLGLPMLGKMANVNTTAVQASRYAAWEATVGKRDTIRLANEIEHRFFANPDSGLSHTQAIAPPAGGTARALWGSARSDSSGKRLGLFRPGSGRLSVTLHNGTLPGEAGGVVVEGVKALGVLGRQGVIPNSKWDLETQGLVNAVVSAEISSTPMLGATEDSRDCSGAQSQETFACLRRNNAILVDTWSAAGAGEVAERTRALVPAGMLKPLGQAMDAFSRVLPPVVDLRGMDKAFGAVEPDILPPDRYGNP